MVVVIADDQTPKYVDEDETLKDDDEDKVGKTRIGR